MNTQVDEPVVPSSGGRAGAASRRWALAFGAIAVLYLVGVVDAWYPTPDSALYQGLGRNLIAGRGCVFNGRGDTTVTPGLPAISGWIERFAGPDAFWAKNLLMCLCGLVGLALAHAALRRMVDPQLALAAVAATALTTVYYHHSHLILTDAPFAMLFWAIVYCSLRAAGGSWAWLPAVAGLCAAAILIRMPALTILGPLAVAFALQKRAGRDTPLTPCFRERHADGWPPAKRLAVAGVILVSIVAATVGFLVVIRATPDQSSGYAVVHLVKGRGLLSRLGQFGPMLIKLPETLGELVTGRQGWWVWLAGWPLLALTAAGLVRLWRRGLRMPAVVIVLSVLAMALAAGIIAAKARYYMSMLPLIALALLEGLAAWAQWRAKRRGGELAPRTRGRIVALAVVAVAVVNAPFLARATIYETSLARRGRYHQAIAGGAYADLYPAAEFLADHTQPGQTILARWDRTRMMHLLTGRIIQPMYSFGINHPWNAEQAELAYRKVLARPAFDWLVHDTGELDARYADRLTQLLDATGGLSLAWPGDGGKIRIYRRRGALTAPATSAAADPNTARPTH